MPIESHSTHQQYQQERAVPLWAHGASYRVPVAEYRVTLAHAGTIANTAQTMATLPITPAWSATR